MSAVDEIRTTKDRRRARRRTAMRALRPGRTPAGAGVAGALVVLGTALVGEMVCAFAGWPTGWSGLPGVLGLAWGEPLVALTGSLMVVSGTALLLLAMIPGRPRLVPLEVGDDGLVLGLTRVGLKRTLVAVAMTVAGVDLAFVRLRRGQIEVTVLTTGNRTGGLLKEVGAAVGDRLEGLGVHGRHEVVVRLRRKSS